MSEIETRQLFGRKQIYTDVEVITAENVVEVLRQALSDHAVNQGEIQYLWDYYRGKTPILTKQKEVRPSVNYKININRAMEIVTFKRGYGFGEPIQYISRGTSDDVSDEIAVLNEQMFLAGKHAEDSALAEWLYVCGLGMRMAIPGKDAAEPVHVYTLDPRYSFVVRYNGLGEPVVMGVKTIIRRDGHTRVHSVYTKDMYFEVENESIVKQEAHVLGMVPIFEYPANRARLGAFEVALPLLDALNEVESNRLDDVEQFVNSFLALLGGTIDDETAKKLDEHKMLCLPEGVDAKYLSAALQQNDIQVLSDNLYNAVLTICGIPYRNGGSASGGDNGVAVYLRNGFSSSEVQMLAVELEFKRSEKDFLRLVLRILRDMTGLVLDLKNVEIKFSRRNYDNLQTKSQVLTTLLNNPKVHPQLAFAHSGLFLDPESAYLQSKAWWEANEQREEEEMQKYVKSLGDDDAESVPEDR